MEHKHKYRYSHLCEVFVCVVYVGNNEHEDGKCNRHRKGLGRWQDLDMKRCELRRLDEIKYPKQEFYAFVSGVDITDMTDSEFSELRKVCETSGVTVLEGQKLNDEQQIAFSEIFGELTISIGTNEKKDLKPFIKPQIRRISNLQC